MKNSNSLVLATDLDGTFLHGPSQLRQDFYQELSALKADLMLIYVTGRGVDAVQELCKIYQLPTADYVLADHGTQIVFGTTFEPVNPLQQEIQLRWNSANHKIRELLSDDPGLELQPINPPYRVAYYYEPALLQTSTVEKIKAAGFECILSCDMYLDILPNGINKGTALLKLLDLLAVNLNEVITCGDSLNDLPLFETGLKSIAVGNAEPALKQKTTQLQNVYQSNLPGVAGICDGIVFHNMHTKFKMLN